MIQGSGPSGQAAAKGAIDENKMNQLEMTGFMTPANVEAATKEAAATMETRAVRADYEDSFRQLDKRVLGGALTPGDREAHIDLLAAKIAKMSAGRFNLQESKELVAGMFPRGGDLPSTRRDKLAKARSFFDGQESGTPTLDRFHLKNPIQSHDEVRYDAQGNAWKMGPNGKSVRAQ
jgi:hypothetical protein